MSLGSVLLRPQVLAAPPPPVETRPLDALTEFLGRLVQELAMAGPGLTIVEEELTTSLEQLIAEIEPRLEAAEARLSPLAEPLLGFVEDAFGAESDEDGFGQVVETGQGVIQALAAVVEGLTAPKITQLLETLFDILETDLGLSEARFRQLFGDTADRIVTRLQADYLGGDAGGAAYNRFALGAAFQELRSVMGQEMEIPPLGKDTLLPPLVERLQGFGLDDKVGEAARHVSGVSEILTPIATLAKFSPSTAFGPHSLGAAENAERTCWYASWLMGEAIRQLDCASVPDMPQVHFNRSRLDRSTMDRVAFHSKWGSCLLGVALFATSIGLEPRRLATNILNLLWYVGEAGVVGIDDFLIPSWAKWIAIPVLTVGGSLERAHFNDVFLLFLMGIDLVRVQLYARWVWLARETVLSILTLLNGNPNYVGGLAHLLGELGTLLMSVILSHTKKDVYGFPHGDRGSWGWLLGSWGLATLANLAFGWGLAFPLARLLSGSWPDTATWLKQFPLKERMLTRFTYERWWSILLFILQAIPVLASYFLEHYVYYFLLHEGATDGVVKPNGTFSARQPPAAGEVVFSCNVAPASDIVIPKDTIVRAPATGSRTHDFDFVTTAEATLAAGQTSVTAPIRFRATENQHRDRIYGEVPAGEINVIPTAIAGIDAVDNPQPTTSSGRLRYLGYPDRSHSPYRLPWEKGGIYQCVQGNLGIWSHTPFAGLAQIYAYDFSHNDGDEVLAMRAGVVWQFVEGNAYGGENANSIAILHDAPPASPPSFPELQDYDENGEAARTLAYYLHGQEGSITPAFAARGITIGTEQAGTLAADPLIVNAFTAQGVDLTALGSAQVPVTLNAAGDPTGPIVVQRGEVIMRADHTGRSAYNHLHVHVRPAIRNAAGDVEGVAGYTIPFVFADPDMESDDGVPQSLRWYKSDNEKVT